MMNTYYDAYVRANCTSTNDGYSAYIGPFTFKTECGWFDEPWTEDFGYNTIFGNSLNPNLPDCWSYYGTGSQYSYVTSSSFYGNTATNSRYLFLRAYQSSFSTLYNLGDTSMVILPLTNDLSVGDLQLLFSARGYSGAGVGSQTDNIIVGTIDSTGDKSSMFIIDTVPMLGSTYQDYTVDLTNTPTDAHSIFMMAIAGANGTYTYGYNESYIDNIEVRQAPQCPEPFGFTTTVSTDTSATIDWSDSSVVSNYFVEWGQSGFTQGTGATIDTVSTSEWSSSSLTSNTTYDFYVQSECSALGINSPWFGPITITTPCSPTAKPLVEGFENLATTFGTATAPNFADCWVQDRGVSASYVRGMSNTYGTVYGNGYMEFWGMAMNSDTLAFSSPPIENLSTEGAEVTFYAYLNSASYLGELEVGVSDFSGSLSSARAATEIKLSTSWQQFSVYLDSNFLQSGDARVSFILPEGNGQWNDLRIDSVTIADLPSCGTYNHMIGSITDTSADLSWDYFGNDCFTIEYGLSGFIQGTGVGSQSGTIDSNITSNYVMSGLNPNTSYDFYVENCCSPGTWEGPFTFSTECTGPLAAGTYTVGSTGNFASLDSVISTLNVCGIAGAVTFELQTGTFVAGNSLGSVNGSSTANTITFTGASGASDTLVQISLSGASNVILDDLFIYNMSSDGVVLNETDNVTISNSTIQVTTTSTSTLAGMPIASRSGQYYYNGSSESNLTIVNNELIGGYYGISLYGSSMNRSSNVHVSDNTFSLQYYYGVNLSYTDGVTFNNNTVSGFRSSSAYGARFYYSNNVEAHENHISGVNYGMYVYQVNGTDNELVNNMLDANVYGIYSYFSDSVAIHHNTVRGNYGFYNYYSSNTDARNNIFIGNTYAVYARFGSNNEFDYNVYNSNGTYLAYTTTLIDSLGEWQTLDSLNNMNAVEGDPVFLSQNDLHVVGLLANDAGDNSVGVTHDIDGDVRPSLIASTVDIGADEFDVVYYDAAITGIVSPSGAACGGDSVEVIIEVTNLGVSLMTSVDATVNFAGQSITGTYALDTLALGESEAIVVGYVSQRVGGFYSLDAEVDLTGDTRATNDLLSATVELLDAQQVSMNLPEFACAGDVIDLEITHPLDGTLMWSSNGDTLGVVDADSTMTLTLTQDTTLTLSAVASMDTTGNVRGIGSGGGNYNFMGPGLQFTVNQSSIIDSVTLYPNAAGSTTIDIKDATGAIVWSSSVSTTATGNTAEQVYLGASMQPGSYTMTASASTCGGLYREFGVTGYPFSTSGNEVSITQGSLTNYHYFFYNWVVTVGGCERPDSTVTIMVHPDPVAAISVDDANATISATDWMANWSTAGTANADSIYVEFSNGTSSNDTSGTVTFTANNAGETVTVIAFGPCSSDTATFTFDVNQISVDEDFMNGTLKIYPNPTRGLFNVEFATATATNVEISIVNMVGQVISNEVVTVNGLYNNQFDLSNESGGVYFIQFTTDNAVLTERITVE
ncbi:right-handed parallel beta-helix repeat-containing protein [Schleiferiaceae bacterium]|nr:right-handed parallel beta-helix repeat-containing protein [Schleiferiaceae bacterium]